MSWPLVLILELVLEKVPQTIHPMLRAKDSELVVPVVALPRSRRQKDQDLALGSSRCLMRFEIDLPPVQERAMV